MTTKKKWAIGIGVFLAFGLLGAILDDDKNGTSSEKKAEPQQIEQTEQNEEAERQAREQKEAERQARKQKEEAERQAREQKEEAERQAREQKEEAERKEAKKKEIAEAGYNSGYERGFNGSSDIIGNPKTISYTVKYGAPKSNEEKELFNIWKENWQKGYDEGNRARYSN